MKTNSIHFKININKDYDGITFSLIRVTKVEKPHSAQCWYE